MGLLDDALSAGGIFRVAVLTLYAINIIIAFVIIFLERRDSASTLAWLLVLFAIPVVGFAFYIFFSQHIARRKIFMLTDKEEEDIRSAIDEQIRDMEESKTFIDDAAASKWKELIRLNQSYGDGFYTQGNAADIIVDGKDLMERMLKDIEDAKESIDIVFFIVKNDSVGQLLIEALTNKAREGVKVRFLVDALGSRQIGHRVVREFKQAGGHFGVFFPPMIRHLAINFNYRNHRKIVVIDKKYGYIGGYNVAEEYVDMKEKFGHWRDTHMKVEGAAVHSLSARFEMDWRTTRGEKSEIDLKAYLKRESPTPGNIGMQMVSSSPVTKKEEVKRGFMKMINDADKSIYIQSPYFVPDAAIMESMIVAARSGLDVKLMIPHMPDHIFVYWATYSYVGQLIKNGVKVYVYKGGFLHAKTVAVDGEVCTIGSTNFDRRSFRFNFECNAFIYNQEFTKKLEDTFEEDLKKSYELTEEMYDNRSTWIKIKESISRLVADLL